MSIYPQHFTPMEADILLPRIQALLAEARRALDEAEHAQEHLLEQRAKVMGNGHAHPPAAEDPHQAFVAAREALAEALAAVEALGVVVKDVRAGLVDFPAWRDGREVFLCWRDGEPRVAWWHDIEAGYVGRQPLGE